jgi:3-phosphoglycerate kinase
LNTKDVISIIEFLVSQAVQIITAIGVVMVFLEAHKAVIGEVSMVKELGLLRAEQQSARSILNQIKAQLENTDKIQKMELVQLPGDSIQVVQGIVEEDKGTL